jgi:hypothetical protein
LSTIIYIEWEKKLTGLLQVSYRRIEGKGKREKGKGEKVLQGMPCKTKDRRPKTVDPRLISLDTKRPFIKLV